MGPHGFGKELMLPKFIDFNTTPPSPYVYPPFFGNPDGTDSTWLPAAASPTGQDELWNIPNNPTYSNDVNMVFNLGGALADISWLSQGDVPMVSFHCENDPYGPIDTGDVIVPTTGDFVVEVMGSRTIQQYIHTYGNNMPFVMAGISDVYTTAANLNNGGLEGLYIFKTPPPSTTPNAFGESYEEEGSPWDWWDNTTYDIQFQAVNGAPAGYGAANSLLGNPDMSSTKGNLYLDTIQGYLNPRMYEVLDLANTSYILGIYGCTDSTALNYDPMANSDDGSCIYTTAIHEFIDAATNVYPNPANHTLNIINHKTKINTISIYNLSGKQVLNTKVNRNQIKLNISSLTTGLYIMNIESNQNTIRRKLIIK